MTEEIDLSAFRMSALPLGMTPTYRRALVAQDGVCSYMTAGRRSQDPPQRCTRSINAFKLYLWGDELLCQAHHDKLRLAARKK
jgi:hypothetical protein